MTPAPSVVIHRDADTVAAAAAARLVTRIVDVQAARGAASIVLTGGTIGISTLRRVAQSALRDTVDWRRLDVWWGDERFLPAGHRDRNETQARDALLDSVPLDPARVHPMPASGDITDPETAAAAYAEELARAARPEDHGRAPAFDLLLLGVGPDGHIASLFPGAPALYDDRAVCGVRGAPKPPPTRITLTLPTINAARQVWFVVAGEDKASAVHLGLSDAGEMQVPAAGAHGTERTLWLVDRAAASKLPRGLERLGSP